MKNDVVAAFAKLAGIRATVAAILEKKPGAGTRRIIAFDPVDIQSCFEGAEKQFNLLRERLPEFFSDFPAFVFAPHEMTTIPPSRWYTREEIERLFLLINRAFEVRANSQLAASAPSPKEALVFISHGRAKDWLEVQSFVEHDVGIATLELAQEPNLGRTVIEKLEQEAQRCSSAVIVMTGDDTVADGSARARESVVHEIGFFQGKFGRAAVCLLYEEGTNVPSNIGGVVYLPFTRGNVAATFPWLHRELKAFYRR